MHLIKKLIHGAIVKWCQHVISHISYCSNIVENLDGFKSTITVGRHTYGVSQRTILFANTSNSPTVTIGNFCSIAPGVVILANVDHPTNLPSTYPFRTLMFCFRENCGGGSYDNHDAVSRGDIKIGHDVWIGQNSIILSCVSIGTGAVIGAGSVVTKDVPPYAIVVGNPAKIVGFRFEREIIEQLLRSKWWTFSDEKIRELEPFFYSNDIDAFLKQIRVA